MYRSQQKNKKIDGRRLYWNSKAKHCMKSVRILSFSGPYFPVFGLNTEIHSVIQISVYSSDQKNSKYGHFLRSESYIFIDIYQQSALNHLIPTLREKCPYSKFFWSVFSRIRTEYGPEKPRIRTLFKYGHGKCCIIINIIEI